MIQFKQGGLQNELSQEAIMRALFENYECIYAIDIETSAYRSYYESDSYSLLQIESSGDDFFATTDRNIANNIYFEDQEYVKEKLSREKLLTGVEKEKYYSFVYRLMVGGEPLYHKIRATKELVGDREYILLGVRNVDAAFRQDKAHVDKIASMYQKEMNHMEAILASAAGYMEVNLTKDIVLEISPYISSSDGSFKIPAPKLGDPMRFSDINGWMLDTLICEGRDKYKGISNSMFLISSFERGEKRASLSFSIKKGNHGDTQPCREVFYLYKDDVSDDILTFCVVYDLTEHQRKEKELRELEDALRMSRIRNSTSQMQPHFLYNALGSIQEIMLEDPDYASTLLGDFTIHLRSCIRAMSSDAPLPFDQELANIKAYINIEKMRLGEKLKVVYDTTTMDFSILPLSIQPLVENAIRHGIYERGEKGGTVTVRSEETTDAWIVTVEDDGVGFDVDRLREEIASGKRDSTGLKNIIFRLDKVMHASVDVTSTVGVGTKVTVSIPKEGGNPA